MLYFPLGFKGEACRTCTSHAQNRSPHFKSSAQIPQAKPTYFTITESTTNLFSRPKNIASNFTSRHQRGCGGSSSWHTAGPGGCQHQGSTAAAPCTEHGSTQQDSTVLIHRWRGHWSSADRKQSCCSHSFYQYIPIMILWRKMQAGTSSSSMLLPVTKHVRMESTRRAHPYEPAGFPREKEHKQGFFLSYPPKAAVPLIRQPWKEAACSSTGDDFSPAPFFDLSVWPSVLSTAKVFTSSILLPRVFCHKNFLRRARLREGFSLGMIFLILFHLFFLVYGDMTHLNQAVLPFENTVWLDKHLMFLNTRMKELRREKYPLQMSSLDHWNFKGI